MTQYDLMKYILDFLRQTTPVSEFFSRIASIVVLLIIFLEISPVKVKPFSACLRWLGEKLNVTTNEGILASLHDRLFFLCDKAVERGCLSSNEMATIEQIYKSYHKIGGNGEGTIKYEAVKKLKIVSEQESHLRDIQIKREELGLEEGKEDHE